MNTLYDIEKTFEENVVFGPLWNGKYPRLPKRKKHFSFLGHPLNSLFGVAASPLTHGSRNVRLMSCLGYDIITYRSVRSIEWHGQKYPHWRFVSLPKQLTEADLTKTLVGSPKAFPRQEVSTANSFGIQSLKPEYWQVDFEQAQDYLLPGQLLILSLMFTPETGKDVLKDAGVVAGYGKETSAKAFEINLAHPNSGMKSLVYEDVATSVAICRRVKKVLGDRPLLAKVGYYQNPTVLREFMKQTSGIIAGLTSANTYAMPIIDSEQQEVFPGRPKAGVSGWALRTLYKNQIRQVMEYKKSLVLNKFVVIAVGGVMSPAHITEYMRLGADAVQAATGVWADPYLAFKYKKSQKS